MIEILVSAGRSLGELGHIALTKRYKNSLAHNVVGAAAYHGNTEMLSYCLEVCPADFIDFQGMEMADGNSKLKPEMNEFTPLQVALVSPHASLEVIKILFEKNADQSVKQSSTGSNILHLAAGSITDNTILEYVFKNAQVNINERNHAGDTPLTICSRHGNKEGARMIEELC